MQQAPGVQEGLRGQQLKGRPLPEGDGVCAVPDAADKKGSKGGEPDLREAPLEEGLLDSEGGYSGKLRVPTEDVGAAAEALFGALPVRMSAPDRDPVCGGVVLPHPQLAGQHLHSAQLSHQRQEKDTLRTYAALQLLLREF